MSDELKVYGVSSFSFLQVFFDLLNPIMSFILLFLTIIYTYQKYKNEKNKQNE
jgi:hypothetical protein